MLAHTKIPVGTGYATILPDMDFETYSEAGYVITPEGKRKPVAKGQSGIAAVGAAVYSEHPTTEVLSLAYDLKDGLGKRLWIPGMAPPAELFDHIANGGLLEAWNSAFEWHIWENVCRRRMGWPALPFQQLRDAMAKSRAHSLPGALGDAAIVLWVADQKIGDGKRLITKFCIPRTATKNNPLTRIRPEDDPADAMELYRYNMGDIAAEAAVSQRIPDLSPEELELWLLDQQINLRGVHIDAEALAGCKAIIEQASEKYTSELVALTGGTVTSPSEVAKISGFLAGIGLYLKDLTADTVDAALKREDLPPVARRVLEIRSSLGAASVKKLFAIDRRVSADGRLKDLFAFCGADRTGRFAGRGPQPQNLPNSGPAVRLCRECGKRYVNTSNACPWCRADDVFNGDDIEWSIEAVEDALQVIATRDLRTVEYYFGDAVAAVSGCLRGLFSAAPGHDLICSDYSAIEAVVLAELAGEQWRIDVFKTHGKIYEMSAAKITGIPFEEFVSHKETTGDHHPMRKKIGKVAELASGYQGGLGAWKNFGADKHLSEEEIKDSIKRWRDESPAIVAFWRGLEDAALSAIQAPGACYGYRGITYGVKDDVLYCQLLSGRTLSYHRPRLHPDRTPWGKDVLKITYEGRDSYTNQWARLETYGGKLCENVVQATARDILTYAMPRLEAAGYPIVLHIHDEIVSEVPEGVGSVDEFEDIMATLPPWAAGWPVKAAGGWRGKRYRKD